MRSPPDFARELGDLGGVQVVGGRQCGQAEGEEFGGGECIGGVEAEIADQLARFAMAQGFEQAGGAHQDRAIAAQQEIDDLLFARLQDARAGDARRDARLPHALDRRAQSVEIEIVERDGRGRKLERGVELFRRAHQEVQRGHVAARTAGRIRRQANAGMWRTSRTGGAACASWSCSTASRRSWFSIELGANGAPVTSSSMSASS